MNLEEALRTIQYSNQWGIWAELIDGKLAKESPARFGQLCFERGGLLDEKVFVCHGETIGDHLADWIEDSKPLDYTHVLIDGWFTEFIDPINEEKPWENADG